MHQYCHKEQYYKGINFGFLLIPKKIQQIYIPQLNESELFANFEKSSTHLLQLRVSISPHVSQHNNTEGNNDKHFHQRQHIVVVVIVVNAPMIQY